MKKIAIFSYPIWGTIIAFAASSLFKQGSDSEEFIGLLLISLNLAGILEIWKFDTTGGGKILFTFLFLIYAYIAIFLSGMYARCWFMSLCALG
ncbi:hypothetical protein [Methylotenera sp.]|uniref:hypothetical protein n=1 Tax=Methylotenera sp. TaxID=2051956 RepID=UPI002732DDCA|nr:hypothetical protein [Methylotenera sp.]MDP3004714.1 hypothetical protein [Methylotenera sp.]